MVIFVPKESEPGETRVPLVPETVRKLAELGARVEIESGLGASIGNDDESYRAAGASISTDRNASLAAADLILRLHPPPDDDISLMKKDAVLIGFLDPFQHPEKLRLLARAGVSSLAMELIPRTTIAQKMDALSSQANLAGYVAVILAAERLNKILPMMMTPAGTISPARVFVIGAGVAGLQAIATAKRLGARVEAYDTRPVVAEQIQSLGARFVKIDVGPTGQTRDGYARELTPEQLERQRLALGRVCASSDIIITTARVFGKPAPRIITAEMIAGMQPGSVIVDLAVESGGNVEGVQLGREIEINGVRVIGLPNLPGRVPVHASLMYSSNLGNLVAHFWDKDSAAFRLDPGNDIIKACLVTHRGSVIHPLFSKEDQQ